MTSGTKPPRVIFIGNIPFEITEEQLIDIFKEVGPVLSFRMMFDRETGRSRGYAFCEYADSETAASAIRNLNGYEIGGRTLKVDKADNDMLPSAMPASAGSSMANRDAREPLPSTRPIQNLPGVPPTASTASIHSILSAPPFNNPQNLLEVLNSLKLTIQNNPDQARMLLSANPALSYALLQSFISLGLIDMSTVQTLLIQSQQAMNQPPRTQAPMKQTPPPPPPNSTQQASADQQKALIMQIMNMTPEQINLLPPQQREQVLQLKQQILMQQQQHSK